MSPAEKSLLVTPYVHIRIYMVIKALYTLKLVLFLYYPSLAKLTLKFKTTHAFFSTQKTGRLANCHCSCHFLCLVHCLSQLHCSQSFIALFIRKKPAVLLLRSLSYFAHCSAVSLISRASSIAFNGKNRPFSSSKVLPPIRKPAVLSTPSSARRLSAKNRPFSSPKILLTTRKPAVLSTPPVEPDPRSYLNQRLAANSSQYYSCLLYTSPSPRDRQKSRMPSSA